MRNIAAGASAIDLKRGLDRAAKTAIESLKTLSRLENVTLDALGRAERVVVNREHTTIIGGKGERKAIEGRCQELRTLIAAATSDYDRETRNGMPPRRELQRLEHAVEIVDDAGIEPIDVDGRLPGVTSSLNSARWSKSGKYRYGYAVRGHHGYGPKTGS